MLGTSSSKRMRRPRRRCMRQLVAPYSGIDWRWCRRCRSRQSRPHHSRQEPLLSHRQSSSARFSSESLSRNRTIVGVICGAVQLANASDNCEHGLLTPYRKAPILGMQLLAAHAMSGALLSWCVAYVACRWQLLLSAAYVFGCAFRSAIAVFDVPRQSLFNTWTTTVRAFSRVVLPIICDRGAMLLVFRAHDLEHRSCV
jgi:hypothetical protein